MRCFSTSGWSENGEMSTSIEEDEAYLTEVMGKEDVQAIPCALVFSDGEGVKLWTGSYGDSKVFEESAAHGKIYLLKSAVGSSEAEYWTKKFELIKAQWQRDDKWREWTKSRISMLRKKWP